MDLLKLRPSDGTAAAIKSALAQAEQSLATNATEQVQAKEARDTALLDGAASEIGKTERTLATALKTGERIAAVVEQLRQRLTVAERAETLAAVEAAKVETEKRRKALGDWWAKTATGLFAKMAEGAALTSAAEEAGNGWARAAQRARQEGIAAEFLPPANPSGGAAGWMHLVENAASAGDFSDPLSPRPVAPVAPPPAVEPYTGPPSRYMHQVRR